MKTRISEWETEKRTKCICADFLAYMRAGSFLRFEKIKKNTMMLKLLIMLP